MKKIILGTYKCTLVESDITEDFTVVSVDLESVSDAEVLVWSNEYSFTQKELRKFPRLKLLINWGTNDSNIKIKSLLLKENIEIKYVDYYATQALSEYTLSLMLLYERKLLQITAGEKIKGRELYGKKVGIIGLGKIGYNIGEILSASFKCQISYIASKDKHLHNFTYKNLKELLSESDYLIITIRDDSFVLTLNDLSHANKDLLVINVTNEHVLPTKTVEAAIKKAYIRGYIADLKSVHHHSESKLGSILVPKAGYLTDQSKQNKKHILQLMLKKYASKTLQKPNSVYIVRHGQTLWNKNNIYQGTLDSNLTKKGIMHAKDIAAFLKDKQISVIYTSPLGRSVSTAKIIAKIIKKPVKVISTFHEIDLGIFQGQNMDEMSKIFSSYFKDRSQNKFIKLYHAYPTGESYYDVYLRTLKDVLRLAAVEENFVIIGHEGINRIIRGIINEKSPEENLYHRQKNNEVITINYMTKKEEIDII